MNAPLDMRLVEQMELEQALLDFHPDYDEACEILDSLIAALGNRIGHGRMAVVQEEAAALRIAIKEAEPCELSEADLAYELDVQRKVDGD
jgi:hypothetical protein